MRYLISLLVCASAIAADLGNPSSLAILQPIVASGGGIDSPTNVAGLGAWYKPESLEGPPEGTITNAWVDSSANVFDLAQATAGNRPYLTNAVTGSFRGLYFDGVDNFMQWSAAALNMQRNQPGCTIFLVSSRVAAATAQTLVFVSSGTSSTQARLQWRANAADAALIEGIARRLDADSASISDPADFPVGPVLYCARWDWGNGSFKLWTNGVVAIDDATFTSSGNTSDTAAQGARIGSSASAGSFMQGVFVEMTIYTNAVSDADAAALTTGYFKPRYGSIPIP